MSLLDDPTDEVAVYPEVAAEDGHGNPVKAPSDIPVYVQGRVQPMSAEKTVELGQTVGTVYVFRGRDWPAGAWSRVQWPIGEDGRDWDVHGEPLWSRGSDSTRHVTVVLKVRGGI